ncbi:nuclear transport factor 2 family protein [Candidatus Poriferisocius sp.]|uniref:nuclear transport factor 2 family protein n=1 Tax=Candidatus Poriferisocius sp. TaxID=3101276 RepID=UPI003B017DB1
MSGSTAELLERIARLEATEAIRNLVARYGMAVDDRDLDAVAEMFTQDAVFRHGDGAVVNEGRQAIVDFYADRLSSFGATYHYPHSHLVELDSHHTGLASGTVAAHAEMAIGGRTFITGLRYYDRYRLDGGQWRFSERSIAMLYYMDMAELAEGGLGEKDRKRYFGEVGPAELPEGLDTWKRFFEAAG